MRFYLKTGRLFFINNICQTLIPLTLELRIWIQCCKKTTQLLFQPLDLLDKNIIVTFIKIQWLLLKTVWNCVVSLQQQILILELLVGWRWQLSHEKTWYMMSCVIMIIWYLMKDIIITKRMSSMEETLSFIYEFLNYFSITLMLHRIVLPNFRGGI